MVGLYRILQIEYLLHLSCHAQLEHLPCFKYFDLVGRIKAKLITAQRMVKSEGFNTESIYSYVGVTKEQQLCLKYLDDIRQDA